MFPTDGGNLLLAGLPSEDRSWIRDVGRSIEYDDPVDLFAPDTAVDVVMFPDGAVISLVADLDGDPGVEIAGVGREGVVGLPIALGASQMGVHGICQIPGPMIQVDADLFRDGLWQRPALRTAIDSYTRAYLDQIGRTAVCNRVHDLDQRLARWLLMCHDRVGGDEFYLTQQYLALMLGVRRPTVSVAARELLEKGMIDYSRGRMRILDREGLGDRACDCYDIVNDDYDAAMDSARTTALSHM